MIDIVQKFAGHSDGASAIVGDGIDTAASAGRPDARIAVLVDAIKRVRLSEASLSAAA